MRGFGILAAAAALVVAFATNSVCAQTASTAPAGKPLALLAGLRPPHDGKHTKQIAHAKAVHEKTAAKSRHSHLAAHVRHGHATRIAARHHAHHEDAVTASAFADEPPPQAAPAPPPSSTYDSVSSAPNEAVAPAVPNGPTGDTAAGTLADSGAAKVQTIRITAANPTTLNDASNSPVATAAVAGSAVAAPAAPAQTVYAAPMHEPAGKTIDAVGSASWIAQVLAALGGAIAAGVVAWFLIGGSRPVRTYG